MPAAKTAAKAAKPQLLHLVFGGELTGVDKVEFKDLAMCHVVGMFPDYESAHKAWQAAARQTGNSATACPCLRQHIAHGRRAAWSAAVAW